MTKTTKRHQTYVNAIFTAGFEQNIVYSDLFQQNLKTV